MTEISSDNIFEILSWLPAKSIYKLKCCSKLFKEILSDTFFASKQAQQALTKEDTSFFVQQGAGQRFNGYTMLHPIPGEELSTGIPKSVTEFFSNSARVIASSNGFVLCRPTTQKQDEIFIVNPATKSYLQIPLPKEEGSYVNTDADLNIVFHSFDDDFIVCLFHDPFEWSSYLSCKIYSHKGGVWRTKEGHLFAGGRNLSFDMPVFHNGSIYLVSDCSTIFGRSSPYYRPYIVSYSLEDGKSKFLQLPRKANRDSRGMDCQMRIFKWGRVISSIESICLVTLRSKVFTVWVLTNHEVCSWNRVLKVRVKGMRLPEEEPEILGYTVLNGDILVFATKKNIYSYGLIGERCMILEKLCEHRCDSDSPVRFVSYSNTLRPFGGGAMPLPIAHCINHPMGEENIGEENSYSC